MFTLWFIVAMFTYSVNPGGAAPYARVPLYQGEFSLEACRDRMARLQEQPGLYVKALTGSTPKWVAVTVLPGWRCVALQVEDE